MNKVEVDRISSLPDEVLTHILSFMGTEDAVRTCVLSKRWKNTWAAVPILNINHKHPLISECHEEDFDFSGDSDEEQRRDLARSEFKQLGIPETRFQQFMTGFLDNRPPTSLERVNCFCNFQCWDETHASMEWLDRVVLLMPLQINISIMYGGFSLDIPDLVFSCASLQHLSMSLWSPVKTIIRPVSINLPSLKFLHLTGVKLHDDFAEKLFMGCPSLEKLDLCRCDLYFASISSEVLKELILISCTLHKQMQISCPNLASLLMSIDLARGDISLKNKTSLVDAFIELDLGDDVPNLNLLSSLSNVAELKFYSVTPVLKEQLEKDIPNCLNFNNLKKLVMGVRWDMCSDFYLIACLLKHSPNLKELELLFDESQGQIQEPRREISGDVSFQYEYLETVKFGPECEGELSSELIYAITKTLGRYVKKIGNLIIS